jgi:hypothetical protein
MKYKNMAFQDDYEQPIRATKNGEGVFVGGVRVTTEVTPTGNKGVVRLEISKMVHCALSLGEDYETYYLDAAGAEHLLKELKEAIEEAA